MTITLTSILMTISGLPGSKGSDSFPLTLSFMHSPPSVTLHSILSFLCFSSTWIFSSTRIMLPRAPHMQHPENGTILQHTGVNRGGCWPLEGVRGFAAPRLRWSMFLAIHPQWDLWMTVPFESQLICQCFRAAHLTNPMSVNPFSHSTIPTQFFLIAFIVIILQLFLILFLHPFIVCFYYFQYKVTEYRNTCRPSYSLRTKSLEMVGTQ